MKRGTPSQERRLERACKHVSDLWFPCNQGLLQRIRNGLASHAFDSDINVLLKELRGDLSLYLYCLRELLSTLKQEGIPLPDSPSPDELFRAGGLARLESILTLQDPPGSDHSARSITESQRQRIEEVIVSASSSQVLAEASKLGPDIGFSAAVLRQLGHTLIAWNYPSVYERAISEAKQGANLDVMLAQVLGFSPSILAITLARSWGIHPILQSAIEDDDDELVSHEVVAAGAQLAKLCQVGEALARANNPQVYPNARADWSFAKTEITSRLGEHGLELIQEALGENCRSYAETAPNFFKPGLVLDPETAISVFERSKRQSHNPFMERCAPHIRSKLSLLYELLAGSAPLEDSVAYLVKEVLQSASFSAGAIYTVEPSSQTLVPQFTFGAAVITQPEPQPAEVSNTRASIISLAYNSQTPIIRHYSGGSERTSLAGVFGFASRIGVLYLEVPHQVYSQSPELHLIHFRSLAHALNDCFEHDSL